MHFHRLGERCRCGHLTLPARFYWETKNDKVTEVSQEKAEQSYLEHLREHMPDLWEKLNNQTPQQLKNQVSKHGGKRVGAGRPKSS